MNNPDPRTGGTVFVLALLLFYLHQYVHIIHNTNLRLITSAFQEKKLTDKLKTITRGSSNWVETWQMADAP